MTDEIVVPPPPAFAVDEMPGAPAGSPPASASASPAPLSAPYRAPIPEAIPAPAPSSAWPVLGLSLWVFGVAMWAFLVMGELVTSYGPGKHDFLVNEGTGAFFVFVVTLGAWGLGLRASLLSAPAGSAARAMFRGLASALLSFLLWGFVTVTAMALFNSVRANIDGKVTVSLGLLAGLAAYGGRRLAGLHRRDETQRDRMVSRVLWTGAALMTIVALAELIAD